MNRQKQIIELAKKKAAKLKKLRADPRYLKVLGCLKKEGLIDAPVPKNHTKQLVEDFFWVGRNIEPRVLELLPAFVLKRPGIFLIKEYPQQLLEAVNKLRRGDSSLEFEGIPLRRCEQWLPHVGRKGKIPSAMKSFRFRKEDINLLRELSEKLGTPETEVLRRALKNFRNLS